jgi:tRNA-5-methyluridine54 2-sulfurtransferase
LFAEHEQLDLELHPCTNCGQPTSAPGMCSFCRLMEKVREGPQVH